MPCKSKKQYKYIQYLRNKYGTKEKAPEKYQWVFDEDWTNVDYKDLPENNLKKYKPLFILK